MTVRARGFTLIEMLLAVSLVALIMIMAYSGLEASIKMADSGEAFIDRSSRARITHEFLRKQLGRLLPLSFQQDGGKNITFEGESERVRFVGPMPGYLGRGGAYVQELYFARGNQGSVLNYRFHMLNGFDEDKFEQVEPVALLEGVARGNFSFRSVDPQGTLKDWSGDWEDGQSVPLMVRLDLEMTPESRLKVPQLVVAMVVDANVARTTPRFSNSTAVAR